MTVNVENDLPEDQFRNSQSAANDQRFTQEEIDHLIEQQWMKHHWQSRVVELALKGFSGKVNVLSLYRK